MFAMASVWFVVGASAVPVGSGVWTGLARGEGQVRIVAVYQLPIFAFRTADDDGSHSATITAGQIQQYVDRANTIWGGAGVHFTFDPTKDLVDINNTLANNDCTGSPCSVIPDQRERDRLAMKHDGKIVVFFRTGVSGAAGASSRCGHSVTMPGTLSNLNLLAHEVGHYLWNTHTFSQQPSNVAEAADAIWHYIEDPNPDRDRSLGLQVFDGDLYVDGTTDTPPDPGTKLWINQFGASHICDPANSQLKIPVTFSDSTSRTYTAQPDRNDIMSYYFCDPTHASTGQQARARYAIQTGNRGALIGQQPGALVRNIWQTQWSGGYTSFLPFAQGTQSWYLIYKRDNGFMRIGYFDPESIGGGNVNVSSATWSTGYTSFMPFRMAGKPWYLIYKKDNGFMRTGYIKPDGSTNVNVYSSTWSTGYTSFMPFRMAGKPWYLIYKKDNGFMRTGYIGSDGKNVNVYSSTWSTGYTSFVPFVLNDKPWYLIYKADNGFVRLGYIGADGKNVNVWSGTWSLGYTTILPIYRGTQPYYVAYKGGDGTVKIQRIRPDGQGVIGVWSGIWETGYTSFLPIDFGGIPGAFTYKAGAGAGAVQQFCI